MGMNVSKNVQICVDINHFLEFKDIIHKYRFIMVKNYKPPKCPAGQANSTLVHP